MATPPYTRNRGSKASLSPSPIQFTANTVREIAMPGIVVKYEAV